MRFEVSTVTLAVAAIAVIESAAYVVSPLRNLIHKSNRRPLPLAHYGVHRRTHRSRSASPLFSDPSDNDDKEDWNADDDIVYDPNRWIDTDETSSLGDARLVLLDHYVHLYHNYNNVAVLTISDDSLLLVTLA